MKMRRLFYVLIGLGLLTQFNNCGTGTDHPGIAGTVLSACDPTNPNLLNDPYTTLPNTNCAQPDQLNLAISPYNDNITIQPDVGDFTVGGTCNNGNYPANIVSWQLNLNGQPVRNSSMISGTYGTSMNTTCSGGTFSAYVDLGYINQDPYDRTGLIAYNSAGEAVYSAYTLVVTITGFTSTGAPVQNSSYGTRTINLNP